VFENRLLKRIFGPRRDEVTGGLRKMHNVELSIIKMITSRRMRWAGHSVLMDERRNACRLLVGYPEG
jgi:hypothetical protein